METVLVIGAAGFIGATIPTKLLNQGCGAVGISKLSPDCDLRSKGHRLDSLQATDNFEFVLMDIEDRHAEIYAFRAFRSISN